MGCAALTLHPSQLQRSAPVEDGAVDKGGELAGADAELVAHRAEAQHHVQVLAHLQRRKGVVEGRVEANG